MWVNQSAQVIRVRFSSESGPRGCGSNGVQHLRSSVFDRRPIFIADVFGIKQAVDEPNRERTGAEVVCRRFEIHTGCGHNFEERQRTERLFDPEGARTLNWKQLL
jgi:hypothetical protein